VYASDNPFFVKIQQPELVICMMPIKLGFLTKLMKLTLKNYATLLAPDLLSQAKKNTVRECDEMEKGHFVAYVDEGSESFDVLLTIRESGEIVKTACECDGAGKYCRHIAALIIYLAKGDKRKTIVKIKKKESKTDLLIEDIDPNKLKDWVRGLIAKNKDIELSFVNYFSVKEQPTPAGVIKIVNDAVKAVVSNKKTIDLTQLKKLVELWQETLAPVIEHYLANVTNEASFTNLHTMLENCINFQHKVASNSKKVLNFIEDTLQIGVGPVNDLKFEEGWDQATGYFIAKVPDGGNSVRMHYLQHLKSIINVSNKDRQLKIIDRLAKQFGKTDPDSLGDGAGYVKFIFGIVNDHELFAKYGKLFKPLYFDNDYNSRLIRLLIDHSHLADAIKYCREQIRKNYKEEYNIMYFQFLKEIYIIQKDDAALAHVLSVLFPFTFNYDDYLFISKRMPEEERKKWRTKMLTRARHLASSNNKAPMEFVFKLADEENAYKKMIGYIDSRTPYGIILQYLEKMAQADKNKLIEVLIRKSDEYSWDTRRANEERDRGVFPEIFRILQKYYTANFLKIAISSREKDRWYSRINNLFEYVKEQLD